MWLSADLSQSWKKMDFLPDNDFTLEQLMPLIRECLEMGKNVRLSPKGVSMLPMLRQGVDTVVLSPIKGKLKKYDLPLYQRRGGHYVLHRIVKAGETYTCVGDNQFELEKGLHEDQMIAVVVAFTRGKKRYSVEDFRYRFYCRFWHYSRPIRRFWRRGVGWLRRLLK